MGSRKESVKRLAVVGIALLVAGAGLAMFFAPSLYEVVDEGRDLRPYESGKIYEIRVADTVTVYAAEESRPDTDAISGSALVALATACLMMLGLLRMLCGETRLRRFYSLAALGFAFLAVDEFFAIHETVGHNLLFLSDLPGVERPDDLLFALFVVPAAIFLWAFRDVLTSSDRAVQLFVVAILLFAFAGASDLAGVGLDEVLEVLSAGCIVAGFVALIAAHASAALARVREAGALGGAPADAGDVPAAR